MRSKISCSLDMREYHPTRKTSIILCRSLNRAYGSTEIDLALAPASRGGETSASNGVFSEAFISHVSLEASQSSGRGTRQGGADKARSCPSNVTPLGHVCHGSNCLATPKIVECTREFGTRSFFGLLYTGNPIIMTPGTRARIG